MTYSRQFTAVRIVFALLFTLAATALSSWAITPVMGTPIGVGCPMFVAALIWVRWSFDRTTPKRWILTGGIVALLVLMAIAGWSAADARDMELIGKVTMPVFASFFFLLLLGVAIGDKTPEKTGET